MKTSYRWIYFTLIHDTGKTKVYNCYNKDSDAMLGQVKWHSSFRKYSFFTEANIAFEETCLNDISDFLRQCMADHKRQKK